MLLFFDVEWGEIMSENILEIRNLTKEYPGVIALNDVSFDIRKNTVHCLVGENGAGKSTLIKVITGAIQRTKGEILLNGKEYHAANSNEARVKGVSTLFQELNVVDQLTVEENLTLGVEETKFGFIKNTEKNAQVIKTLKSLDPSIDPKQSVSSLCVAKKQIVEIAKAVSSNADVIIMDEPTASLSETEIQKLFGIVKDLRKNNVTVIYISHRLDEIFELADDVTVMRDGRHIETKPITEVKDRVELIRMMIGKTIYEAYIPPEVKPEENILQVENVSNKKLKNISFNVKKGEIVGFYGLIGAGKTEIARAIYGEDPFHGTITFEGKPFHPTPHKAIKAGVALVPEERRTQGLFTMLTIRSNVPVMSMNKVATMGFLNIAQEKAATKKYIDALNIVTHSMEKEVAKLSGGNQQKIVFAKSLFSDADLLMLDEPTRGIDVGAKSEIYTIIRNLRKEGKSVMIFSSELTEIVNMCDRIYLLYDGELCTCIENGGDIDTQQIIHIVTGGE
ncbi:MAG: tylosin resistance ATP-binding protein TlrC [Clostridia bacterium]|jgi:ribose transport system ATP-binding protein|nr:tylosin resistance ATP-binding protein TlrC [Clostridia bacterium]